MSLDVNLDDDIADIAEYLSVSYCPPDTFHSSRYGGCIGMQPYILGLPDVCRCCLGNDFALDL